MIIIHNKKFKVFTYFDRNTDEIVDNYSLELNNRTTNETYNFENLENLSTMKSYYDFRIPFSGVTDGEYEYVLTYVDNNQTKIADKGLLVVGNYEGLDKASYDTTRVYNCYDPLKK